MGDNRDQIKWLELFVFFALLCSAVCADNSTNSNSTDYPDEEFEDFLLIQPAPEVVPQCGVNEVYQNCEVNCIDCESRGMCEPENCHIGHCDCRMYFVHLTPGGPCEHVSACPARECPENEVFRHCGPFCEYCDMAPCRSLECLSRCYCKEGYRRNRETGKCVPTKECPESLVCLANDAVARNGSASEYCLPTESEALRANETMEEERCYCPSGFKRNIHGWCIEEELCHFVACMEETEFQSCPRKCNTTCWNYGDATCKEDGQCYPSCFCKEGYVLNEFFVCIPLEMCPPGSNAFVPTLPPPTVGPIVEPALEETSEASAASTAESSSAASSSSTETAESSSEKGSSAPAESSSGSASSSAAATAGSESSPEEAKDTDKTKTKGTEETKVKESDTTETPKKPPKKAISSKIYKSAARPGKTVSPMEDDDE